MKMLKDNDSTVINADDFGLSEGVNLAIEKMFLQKKLNSASLIIGCHYQDAAIKIANQNQDLKVGLHFNLSNGNPCAKDQNLNLLSDKNSKFKNGFLKLLLLAIFKKKEFLRQVEIELDAQLSWLKQSLKSEISHIDGHRHIHYIPGIFALIVKKAEQYQIPRIRIINENLYYSWRINKTNLFIKNAGIIKWLLLRFFGVINGANKVSTDRYFFSILNSCELSKELIAKIKIPKKYSKLEIMIHPGDPDIDSKASNLEEKPHLLSKMRYQEQL
jgi:predicted glycoside hydrolase/deacetylase ChbG (UPF0249 family)